jgi:hypothetical protein
MAQPMRSVLKLLILAPLFTVAVMFTLACALIFDLCHSSGAKPENWN